MSKRTLFLDRDGVINRQIIGGYVTSSAEFEFLPGVKEALAKICPSFDYVFIVTNQQGVGKGIYSEADLDEIHRVMTLEIEAAGGRIDKIYYCGALAHDHSPNRKPQPGMGLQAKSDFPDIDFSQALMVGDTVSDMQFGRNLGVKTIYLSNRKQLPEHIDQLADAIYSDLAELSENLH